MNVFWWRQSGLLCKKEHSMFKVVLLWPPRWYLLLIFIGKLRQNLKGSSSILHGNQMHFYEVCHQYASNPLKNCPILRMLKFLSIWICYLKERITLNWFDVWKTQESQNLNPEPHKNYPSLLSINFRVE